MSDFLRATFDRPHHFATRDGQLPVTLTRLTTYHTAGRVRGLEIDAQLAPATAERVFSMGLFDTAAAHRTERADQRVEAAAPWRMTLFLSPRLLPVWFDAVDVESGTRRIISALSSDERLLDASSWTFVSAGRAPGGHRFELGFRHAVYGAASDAHLLPIDVGRPADEGS